MASVKGKHQIRVEHCARCSEAPWTCWSVNAQQPTSCKGHANRPPTALFFFFGDWMTPVERVLHSVFHESACVHELVRPRALSSSVLRNTIWV